MRIIKFASGISFQARSAFSLDRSSGILFRYPKAMANSGIYPMEFSYVNQKMSLGDVEFDWPFAKVVMHMVAEDQMGSMLQINVTEEPMRIISAFCCERYETGVNAISGNRYSPPAMVLMAQILERSWITQSTEVTLLPHVVSTNFNAKVNMALYIWVGFLAGPLPDQDYSFLHDCGSLWRKANGDG